MAYHLICPSGRRCCEELQKEIDENQKDIEIRQKELDRKKKALEEHRRSHDVVKAFDFPAFSFPADVGPFQQISSRRDSCITPGPEDIFGAINSETAESTPNSDIAQTPSQPSVQSMNVGNNRTSGWGNDLVDLDAHQQAFNRLSSTSQRHNGNFPNMMQGVTQFPTQQPPFAAPYYQVHPMMAQPIPMPVAELVPQHPPYPFPDYQLNPLSTQSMPNPARAFVPQQSMNQDYRFNPMARLMQKFAKESAEPQQQQQFPVRPYKSNPMVVQTMPNSIKGALPSTSTVPNDDCVIIENPPSPSSAEKKKKEERFAKRKMIYAEGEGWIREEGITYCAFCSKQFENGRKARKHAIEIHREQIQKIRKAEKYPGQSMKQEPIDEE